MNAGPEGDRDTGALTGADAAAVARALAAVTRTARLVDAMRGAAIGLAMGLAVLVTAAVVGVRSSALVFGLLTLGGAFAGVALALFPSRNRYRSADLVEAHAPESRNVVRTAAEILDGTLHAESRALHAVHREAARVLDRLDRRNVVPAGRSALGLGVAGAAWGLAFVALPGPMDEPRTAGIADTAAPDRLEVEVVVHAPAYAALEPVVLRDPERISALEGSRLELTVRVPARTVTVETVEGRGDLAPASTGEFRGEFPADADGFVSVEAHGDGGATLRRMMGLAVHPDPPPHVRIEDPGRDLLLADGDTALQFVVEATDELGLDSLELVFTRVTGFGEVFDFTEGSVPLQVSRERPSRWIGRARWPLGELELERGDIVVYHARAHDRRPGSTPGESETYVVEIRGSEAGLSGGFAGEDDLDRYALSQQMLVVLTQRLMARRDSITGAEFDSEARTLAAMQRRIRAEFVFMLGGELEDDPDHEHISEEGLAELHEEAHALADAEAAEGRLAQQGRLDLTRAVQSMSHAAALLAAVDMDEALSAEETALVFLQRAFSSSRYILRAMTEREQLDFSRRLTGFLASALPDERPRVEATPDPGLDSLRGVLADLATLVSSPRLAAEGPDAPAELARRVLRVAPPAPSLQALAATLGEASDALADGRIEAARSRLTEAADALFAELREAAARSPGPAPSVEERRLDGALLDALSSGALSDALSGALPDGPAGASSGSPPGRPDP